jgi:hypothetical protein
MKSILLAVLTASTLAVDAPVMLSGPWVPEDSHQIDFASLPQVSS